MLMVLEINFLPEYTRTTKTADFKKFINSSIPVIQSADNINAPPFFYISKLYVLKKIKVPDPIKYYFLEFFQFFNINFKEVL